MYAQHDEDVYLYSVIRDQKLDIPHIIVDIGAFDGVTISNSRMFIEKGWKGYLFEPFKPTYDKLVRNMHGFDNAMCLNVAVADRDGTQYLHRGGEGEDTQLYVSDIKSDTPVITSTVKTLVESNAIPREIGILSIDTEGTDTEILDGIFAERIYPAFIIIESNDQSSRLLQIELAHANGYHLLNILDMNCIFVRNDIARWIPR